MAARELEVGAVNGGWGDPRAAKPVEGVSGIVDARCDACGAPMACDVAQCIACGSARSNAPTSPGTFVRMLIPVGRLPLAIVAGYLGLVSLGIVVLAPFAIYFAWTALRALKTKPQLSGRGRAWFGLVAGIASLVGWGLHFLTAR